MAERRIDFRGIPESSDEALRRAHRVGLPHDGPGEATHRIRLDPRLLAETPAVSARQCKPYQALVHEILEAAVKNAA